MTMLSATAILLLLVVLAAGVSCAQLASCSFVSFDRGRWACLAAQRSHSLLAPQGEEEPGRRARKAQERKRDYERRRNLWLERYGTFRSLRSTFGSGPIWGDLSPEQTRRLYHTLLPRSMLGLYEMGLMKPDELAPLAYEARIAAKKYARSRCIWTGRVATAAFDQYRNLRDRGRFGSSSMSWEQLWHKYEAQIVQEECADALNGTRRKNKKFDDETLTMRIYLRILERSCATNRAFDSLFLKDDEDDSDRLAEIASKLENDVRDILLRPKESAKAMRKAAKAQSEKEKAERKEEKKEEKRKRKAERKKERREKRRNEKEEGANVTATAVKDVAVPTVSQQWEVLRILAGTRQKFRLLLQEKSRRE